LFRQARAAPSLRTARLWGNTKANLNRPSNGHGFVSESPRSGNMITQKHNQTRQYLHQHIKRLIDQYGGRAVTLQAAPDAAALALIHYMAVDGEAWSLAPALKELQASDDEWKSRFVSTLPWYREQYGDFRIGLVTVPMEGLIPLVMKSGDIVDDWQDFGSYHAWYVGYGHMPDHDVTQPLWPVILDGKCGDEVFQDGWHRFHHYYRAGIKQVPCLYYL
jgi:hypothetical protein